ncbi:PEP-CTERM protein-sorting domain-containing protein [Roseateles sp. YR242]|uniref:PEP-CTERM sorting domain-containing protein n=1 Tax=Roseateles sp. YR242 TaxID=1855305 RepID=UPI0008CD2EF2|nr:PEP-CTERM sorting domain-containing protein [Roseateles sp. YR242]SEK27071.1 PEP-CTERM protein-sorting domain-containing protein [Roseateles sp. YR242]
MLTRLIARLALATAGLIAVALPAGAATITFEDLASTYAPAYNRYASQGLVFSTKTTYQTYSHSTSVSDSGHYSFGTSTWGNITGYFTTAVNTLSMLVGDEGYDSDTAVLNVYDSANNLLASVYGSGASWFTLSVSTATNIARFEIIQTGNVAIDNLTFSSKVPEPGSLALAGLALVAVGVARRRKQA